MVNLRRASAYTGLSVVWDGREVNPRSTTPPKSIANRTGTSSHQRSERQEIPAQNEDCRKFWNGSGEISSPASNEENVPDEADVIKSLKEKLSQLLENALIGYTWKKVFNIIGGNANADDDFVSTDENDVVMKQVFTDALSKINRKHELQQWNPEEFDEVAKLFETADGLVSIQQFREFCFGMNSRKWNKIMKWYNTRKEKQNDPGLESIDGEATFTKDLQAKEACDEDSEEMKPVVYSCGPEVQNISHSIWQHNLPIDVHLLYCKELNVITVRIQNGNTGKYYKPLYVDRIHIPVSGAVNTRKYVERNDDWQDAMMNSIDWQVYSDFFVPRIRFVEIDDVRTPKIVKLCGDEFTEFVMDKPSNMAAPDDQGDENWVKYLESKMNGVVDEFNQAAVKAAHDSIRKVRATSLSCDDTLRAVRDAMDAIHN